MGRDRAPDWQDQLQQSLRRAQDAMHQGLQQQDEMVKAWTSGMRDAYPDWGRERWQRRLEKKMRKRAEREARIANASLFEGYFWSVAAVVLFIVALWKLEIFWWLMFPAAGLGSRGAKVLARYSNAKDQRQNPPLGDAGAASSGVLGNSFASTPASDPISARARRFGSLGNASSADFASSNARPTQASTATNGAPAQDPRDARVDAICDKILLELRESPEHVREIFLKPEQTISALRDTCKNLTRRERDVRRFLSPDEDARLMREREALQKRIDAEADEVTKMRLASALAALDQQRDQRAELGRSASRFEAEQTRISYTLESLYTQVVRMRSADAGSADVAGAGLRRSLDLLSQEVNALADALEKVNAQQPSQPAAQAVLPPRESEQQRMRAVADGPAQAPSNSNANASPSSASNSAGQPLHEKA